MNNAQITQTLSLAASALIHERASRIAGPEWADGPHASSTRIRAEKELLANTPSGSPSPLSEIRRVLDALDALAE